jgi:threonine aldolase
MPDIPVDLRSDTVTRPTAGMRAALAEAEVGDDHRGEDPTVRALEEEVAGLLGHEAAVFVPSGTMGNNIALRLLAEPGTEVLADNECHVVSHEMGGLAAIGGIQTRTLVSQRGVLTPAVVAPQLHIDPEGPNTNGNNYSRVITRAVAIENTHVCSGGRAWRLAEIDALSALVGALGIALHCDGARIWNASVATGTPLDEYGRRCSTLSVCLSKGLGAPAGSLVVTDAGRAEMARALRRQLGGGMRQSGILAAAGIYALHHHIERLAEDHRRAGMLARRLAEVAPERIDAGSVETNIVLFEVRAANRFVAEAGAKGVLVGAISPTTVRAVTHLDIGDELVGRGADVLCALLERDAGAGSPLISSARPGDR